MLNMCFSWRIQCLSMLRISPISQNSPRLTLTPNPTPSSNISQNWPAPRLTLFLTLIPELSLFLTSLFNRRSSLHHNTYSQMA